MPPPTTRNETPVCWIRVAFGGRVVCIVQTNLSLPPDVETVTLARASLPAGDEAKRYWVFSIPKTLLNFTGSEFIVLQTTPAIKGRGFEDYDLAEQQYEDWALPDAGKAAVKRGSAGLLQIGKED